MKTSTRSTVIEIFSARRARELDNKVLPELGWRRADPLKGYQYPRWLLSVAGLGWLLTVFLAVKSVGLAIELFQ